MDAYLKMNRINPVLLGLNRLIGEGTLYLIMYYNCCCIFYYYLQVSVQTNFFLVFNRLTSLYRALTKMVL